MDEAAQREERMRHGEPRKRASLFGSFNRPAVDTSALHPDLFKGSTGTKDAKDDADSSVLSEQKPQTENPGAAPASVQPTS